jgi:hypothetical protein
MKSCYYDLSSQRKAEMRRESVLEAQWSLNLESVCAAGIIPIPLRALPGSCPPFPAEEVNMETL